MKKVSLLTIFMALIYAGCATTDISGYKNHDYTGKALNKIMVFVNVDLQYEKVFEDAVTENFKYNDLKAIGYYEIFNPGEEYTSEQYTETLNKHNIDGVLIINVLGAGYTESYIPETETSDTKGKGNVIGNTLSWNKKTVTHHYGGYNVSKPQAKSEGYLYNVKDGKEIWKCSLFSRGSAYANWGDLASSGGEAIVRDLLENNLVH